MSVTRLVSRSPQSPGDVVVEVDTVTATEAGEARAAGAVAQRTWASWPAARRAGALNEAADRIAAAGEELTTLAVREVGKPLVEAEGEVARSVSILRYYAQSLFAPVGAVHEPSLSGLLFTRRHPRGVAGLITPWNFPFAIPLWKAAPALAAGNAVLLKPAPEATACALRLGELIAPALPPSLLQVLPGYAETGRAVVENCDILSFTGSIAAGMRVSQDAVQLGIPLQAEMGGQNASVVLPDADLPAAALAIAASAFGYAGQKCTATKRVVAVGDLAPLRDALASAVGALPVGDPMNRATVVGPVINEQARAAVMEALHSAQRQGAVAITGDLAIGGEGYFVAPVVLADVARDHVLLREEVFGPICTLQSAASLDEATAIVRSVRHGLVSAIFTCDLPSALRFSEETDTGLVKVNAPTTGVDFYLPFGGEKSSSYGAREQGLAALDFYSSTRTVTVAY